MGPLVYGVISSPLVLGLTDRLNNYPKVQFLVIVNPDNGPGNNTMDPNFQRELPKLTAMSNVRTIGYVHTGWATRDMAIVLNEVSAYASWANKSARYELDGIFFDEAPNNYTQDRENYMKSIDEYVKSDNRFGGVNYVPPASGSSWSVQVVHNPGSIPDDNRLFSGADLIVVFEGPYSEYSSGPNSAELRNALQQLPSRDVNNYGRKNYAYMFNALPSNWSQDDLSNFIYGIEGGAQYMFVSDNDPDVQNIYATFGSNWNEFIEIVSTN